CDPDARDHFSGVRDSAKEAQALIAADECGSRKDKIVLQVKEIEPCCLRGLNVDKDQPESTGRARCQRSRQKELYVRDSAVDGAEELLCAERLKIIRESEQNGSASPRVGAHQEARARRAEDRSPGGIYIEEIGRHRIRVRECIWDAVPVDLAPQAAKRAVRACNRSTSH